MFSERSVTLPDLGEIVAVRYEWDEDWYRARVVNPSSAGKTKVPYVTLLELFFSGAYKKACLRHQNNHPASLTLQTSKQLCNP